MKKRGNRVNHVGLRLGSAILNQRRRERVQQRRELTASLLAQGLGEVEVAARVGVALETFRRYYAPKKIRCAVGGAEGRRLAKEWRRRVAARLVDEQFDVDEIAEILLVSPAVVLRYLK